MALNAERLRQARQESGLSQRELAHLCGIGHVLIYRYENSVSEPSFKHLATIAEKLNVSLDYLAGLTDNPRGQVGDRPLQGDEKHILETFRRDGWPGVFKLGAERIAK